MVSAPLDPLELWEGLGVGEWSRRLGVTTAEFYERISSTSDRAAQLVDDHHPLPALVLADRQLAGRGRRGRRWQSDSSQGLWFTVVHEMAAAGPVLPLRVGLAVALALEELVPGLRCQVKWPNDLLVGGRKLGGVLCEHRRAAVMVGVGLNLNHTDAELPTSVSVPATSLRLETGEKLARSQALLAVVPAVKRLCQKDVATIPPKELQMLNDRSPLAGRRVTVDGVVLADEGEPKSVTGFFGVAGDVCGDGSLEVVDEGGGVVHKVVAGSVIAPNRP